MSRLPSKSAVKQKFDKSVRMSSRAGRLSGVGAWCATLKDRQFEWCPLAAKILDEPDRVSLKIEEGFDYFTPEYRNHMITLFQDCVEHGTIIDEVCQMVTANGRYIWGRVIAEAIQGDEGKTVAVEGALLDVSDLISARNKSKDLSQTLFQTLESITDAFILLDAEWCFLFLNTRAETLWRRPRSELLGKNIWEEYPVAVGNPFYDRYHEAVKKQCSVRFREYSPLFHKWFEVDAYPTSEGLAIYFRDVTAQQERDQQLRLLEAAVSHQNDVLIITEAEPVDGPDGPKIIYVNDAFERQTGYSRFEVIGKTPRILQGPKTQQAELARIKNALMHWQPVRAELINYTKSGEEFWLEIDIVPLANETGWFTHWMAIQRDITERKAAEEKLLIAATRDALTGLFNRETLRNELIKQLQKMQGNENGLALLFMDLDGFKNVNDTLGHDNGDALLVRVAQRINKTVSGSDIVARMGGDEFMVLTSNSAVEDLEYLSRRLLDAFRRPFRLKDRSYD